MADGATLGRDELASLVPHGGSMCLLDAVRYWDDGRIECLAHNQADVANPLRADGRLHAVNAVEYAAQAMAVHGGLVDGSAGGRPGMLVSVRNVRWRAQWLENRRGPLKVNCRRLGADNTGVMFEFEVTDGDGPVATGRGMIAFPEGGAVE